MKIKDLLNEAVKVLQNNKIENPIMHARLLLEFAMDKSKSYIVANDSYNVEIDVENKYNEYIKRLISGEPFQYITNYQEFMKLDFYVDNNVLIPRADTEILVEEAINKINSLMNKKKVKVLDMCTGSGAIAIAIAKYVDNVEVYGVDLSEKALEVARKNSINNNVDDKCTFIKSDMFENIKEKFDIIISNPPYIKTKVIESLDDNVKKEPMMALDGGETGLDFYKILAEKSFEFLNENGMLFLEIGYDQKEEVMDLLKINYKNIYSRKDLAQNDRIVVAEKK